MRSRWLRGASRLLAVSAALWLMGGGGALRADPPGDWGGGGEGYELSRDEDVKHAGKASGSVKSVGDGGGFGTLTQGFRADEYRGKRLRLSAFVKAEGVEKAGLWMRIDGKEKTALTFDNMDNRPVKGTSDWKKVSVVLDVPEDAEEIYFGFLLAGGGQAWVDDMAFEAVGKDVASTAMKVAPGDRRGDLNADTPKEPRNLDFEG